jgi:hypothetical protein
LNKDEAALSPTFSADLEVFLIDFKQRKKETDALINNFIEKKLQKDDQNPASLIQFLDKRLLSLAKKQFYSNWLSILQNMKHLVGKN